MKDGYRYCYRVVRECRVRECSLRSGSLAHLVPSSADARVSCHCRVTRRVVFAITSSSSKRSPSYHTHGSASTAHVDDTLGGSALSGMATLRWKQ